MLQFLFSRICFFLFLLISKGAFQNSESHFRISKFWKFKIQVWIEFISTKLCFAKVWHFFNFNMPDIQNLEVWNFNTLGIQNSGFSKLHNYGFFSKVLELLHSVQKYKIMFFQNSIIWKFCIYNIWVFIILTFMKLLNFENWQISGILKCSKSKILVFQ